MSCFRDCVAARDYFQRFIDLGLGAAQPVLDRRGCDCTHGPVPLGDPGDGERLSEDGAKVFVSCRRMEA